LDQEIFVVLCCYSVKSMLTSVKWLQDRRKLCGNKLQCLNLLVCGTN